MTQFEALLALQLSETWSDPTSGHRRLCNIGSDNAKTFDG